MLYRTFFLFEKESTKPACRQAGKSKFLPITPCGKKAMHRDSGYSIKGKPFFGEAVSKRCIATRLRESLEGFVLKNSTMGHCFLFFLVTINGLDFHVITPCDPIIAALFACCLNRGLKWIIGFRGMLRRGAVALY
jgi:hypothetical protein